MKEALEKVKGYLYSRESFGTVDGPGIRYVFFLQGCPLRCLYCHNPDSLPFHTGEEWTPEQVLQEVEKFASYIKNGGVTFSGGEPLSQPEFLASCLQLLEEKGYHTAIDTAGCISLKTPFVKEALSLADLILLDIKSAFTEESKRISGKGNETAFATLDFCESIGKPVWIRQVIVEGYTLEASQLELLGKKLQPYTCIQRVELLPFHKLGEPKWEEISRPYVLGDTPATTKEQATWASEILLKYGLPVVFE